MPYLYREHFCLKPDDLEFPDSHTQWPALGDVWNCSECAACWRWEKSRLRKQFKGARAARWIKIP
jgi:hypothetical protein